MFQPAVAIFDFTPDEKEGYLSFLKDDNINIQVFYENGWAYGHKLDNSELCGYIPINHVTLLQVPLAEPEKP
jgi:hypothetical protein